MIRVEKGSIEEERKIERLKERIIKVLPPKLLEDQTLFYRFLKARDFNIDLAEAMLRKHISDRRIYGFDDMESIIPNEVLKAYYPDSFVGYDKEGFLVRYFDGGNFDLKGVVSMFQMKQMVQHMMKIYSEDEKRMIQQCKKLGKQVSQLVYIFNVEKFSLFQATYKKGIEFIIKGHTLLQDNYPEWIRAVYVINSSFYFGLAFSILKTVYAGPLLQKIRIYEKDGWREALLEAIDADVLPAFLGGNRTDPDGNPLCESFIIHGKKIPEELYKNKSKKTLSQEQEVKRLFVSRSSCVQVPITIDEPNTDIEWEFETKSRDIGFSLYYKSDSEGGHVLEELIPNQRTDTDLTSEIGLFKCHKIGTYIMKFDNSHSWFRSKELFYRITLSKTKEIVSEVQ